MCDYCGCRTRPRLAQLARDHERILNAVRELRTATDTGDAETRMRLADSLVGVLEVHGGIEETALATALRCLEDHIHREEYDLFPAAHQVLDDAAWDRVHRDV